MGSRLRWNIKPNLKVGQSVRYGQNRPAYLNYTWSQRDREPSVTISRTSNKLWQICPRNCHDNLFTSHFSNEMTAMLAVVALLGKKIVKI